MKNKIVSIAGAMAIGAAGSYLVLENKAQSKALEVQAEATSIKDDLLGYTKYTDYISAGKQVLTEQAKFLAAKVVRDYTLVENVEVGRFGLTSNGTVVVDYAVEYSFGFNLQPDSFEIRSTPSGIELKIGKPILVAAPAVTPLKSGIPNKGVMTDEKTAIIKIQQRLPAIAMKNGVAMASEEPIRAVCEKKLVEFLKAYLGKQPGVKQVPSITIVYK